MCAPVNALVCSLLLLIVCLSKNLDCKFLTRWNLVGDKVLILTYPHRTATRTSSLIKADQASGLIKLKSNFRQRSTMPSTTAEQLNNATTTTALNDHHKVQLTILSSILGN